MPTYSEHYIYTARAETRTAIRELDNLLAKLAEVRAAMESLGTIVISPPTVSGATTTGMRGLMEQALTLDPATATDINRQAVQQARQLARQTSIDVSRVMQEELSRGAQQLSFPFVQPAMRPAYSGSQLPLFGASQLYGTGMDPRGLIDTSKYPWVGAQINAPEVQSWRARVPGTGPTSVFDAAQRFTTEMTATGANTTSQAAANIRTLEQSLSGAAKGMDNVTKSTEHANRTVGRHIRHIAEAILVYEGFRQVQQLLSSWVRIHREMDWAVTQFRINVGITGTSVDEYIRRVQTLAFATGTSRPEVFETATLATRLNRPELAAAGTQVEMIFGTQSTQAVRDLFAIQQQFEEFGVTLPDIMNNFARLIQSGGLTGSEILDLSETWGAFARQFNEDLTGISSLFVALGTVLGETGGSLEVFMRHLERFYTDEGLKKLTKQYTGIDTVTYDAYGEEIRTPMIDILSSVAMLTQNEIQDIAEFMPQELGQKSRQFFNTMISQWDTMQGVIEEAATSTYTWEQATIEATESFEIAARRVGVSWQNLLSSIGDTDAMKRITSDFAYLLEYISRRRPVEDTIIRQNYGQRFWGTTEAPRVEGITPRVSMQMARVFEPVENLDWAQNVGLFRSLAGGFARQQPELVSDAFRADEAAVKFSDFVSSKTGEGIARAFLLRIREEFPSRFGAQETLDPLIQQLQSLAEPRWQALLSTFPKPVELGYTYKEDLGPRMPSLEDATQIILEEGVAVEDVISKYQELIPSIEESARAHGFSSESIDKMNSEFVVFTDKFGNVLGRTTGNVDVLGAAAESTAESLNAVSRTLSSLSAIALPAGVTTDEFFERYGQASQRFETFSAETGIPIGEKTDILITTVDGLPIRIGEQMYDSVARVALGVINEEERIARQASSEGASRHREAVSLWREILREIPGVSSPSSVTDVDYRIKTPAGTYEDKWDEPVRRARADVEHILAGRQIQYGLGSTLFSDIFTPEIMGFAMGADLDTKREVLQEQLGVAEEQYYNLERPWEEYEPYLPALVSGFGQQIEARKQRAYNEQRIHDALSEAGYAPEDIAKVMEQFEPPFARLGDQVANQMSSSLKDDSNKKKMFDAGSILVDEIARGLLASTDVLRKELGKPAIVRTAPGAEEARAEERFEAMWSSRTGRGSLSRRGEELSEERFNRMWESMDRPFRIFDFSDAKDDLRGYTDKAINSFVDSWGDVDWSSTLSSAWASDIQKNEDDWKTVGIYIGKVTADSMGLTIAREIAGKIIEYILEELTD